MQSEATTLYINTDGGARGNPGPSAVGVVFELNGEQMLHQRYIGEATNNTAEYQGLLDAVEKIKPYLDEHSAISHITIRMDSELVVKQVSGIYRIKEPHLQQLALSVRTHLQQLSVPYSLIHVRREQNKIADSLVNQALDAKLHPSNVQTSHQSTQSATS